MRHYMLRGILQSGYAALYAAYLVFYAGHLQAEPAPLPNPLSLQQVLDLADMSHPDLAIANSLLEKAYARQDIQSATDRLQVKLDLNPQLVKLTENGDIVGDSYASLSVTKKLYDFGYSDALTTASEADVEQFKQLLTQSRLQHRVDILRDFVAVILADMRYTFENEEMAQLYVKFDRLRDQHSLGMVSDVNMLDAQNIYREQLDIRDASDHQRRLTRQRLALRLNRPDQPVLELVMPTFAAAAEEIPEFSDLYTQAKQSNPGLLALQQNVRVMQEQLQAQKSQFNPSISANFDINEYERSLSSRADIRIGVQLTMPLYLGGKEQAVSRLAYANFLTSQSQLQRAEYTLREQLLELLNRLATLKIEQRTASERLTLQDMVLDRQRALYELEIQASMGTSMARLTRAQWLAAKVDIDIALTRAQIDALLGKPFTVN